MKILSCTVENFGSYERLNIDLSGQGLTLIQGATGSGKSTLCDIVPWVLFGKTAKGGAVDEVLSFPGDKVTKGEITIKLGSYAITVVRQRGKKNNDLYFYDSACISEIRGKDINDTQKLLNQRLTITSDLYLSGVYYHEFSQIAQFFTTTAKNRRAITEQLVDLSLAIKLQGAATSQIKDISDILTDLEDKERSIKSNIALLERLQVTESTKVEKWEAEHHKTIDYVIKLYEKFEAGRQKIVSKKCNSCGTVLEHPREVIDKSENPNLSRLAELEAELNPHAGSAKDFTNEIMSKKIELDNTSSENFELITEIGDLELLLEVLSTFRSVIVKNTITEIQNNTNSLLSTYFDAEIKINLEVLDSDKLEVSVHKDGNVCSFTQLSKGQRQILKLCFGVSCMKTAANYAGVQFEQIFFDEALDGLDDNMKMKAFTLLKSLELEYNSIFVVEHSESLKTMFNNKFTVELVNGKSEICQN